MGDRNRSLFRRVYHWQYRYFLTTTRKKLVVSAFIPAGHRQTNSEGVARLFAEKGAMGKFQKSHPIFQVGYRKIHRDVSRGSKRDAIPFWGGGFEPTKSW